MLADIAGKPMIAHVVERVNQSSACKVIVATDDARISDALAGFDCEVCMSAADHQSGTDRLAEVVKLKAMADDQIVVNVQGDEPLIPAQLIEQVAQTLSKNNAVMATAAHPITNPDECADPNVVKVVINHAGNALYFSRATIPYARDGAHHTAWRHIGIYAYRAGFLKNYHSLKSSQLEQIEKLEQLRVLDNGHTIAVVGIDYDPGLGVDTAQDLARVQKQLKQRY